MSDKIRLASTHFDSIGTVEVQETFWTIQEIAGLLKVNAQTVYNWVDQGTLRAVRIGSRRVRVRDSELERFIRAGGDVQNNEEEPDPKAVAREELGEAFLQPRRLRGTTTTRCWSLRFVSCRPELSAWLR